MHILMMNCMDLKTCLYDQIEFYERLNRKTDMDREGSSLGKERLSNGSWKEIISI